MAISEVCKFEIEDSVDKACAEKGISKAEAFRALEKFYNGIGVAVSFGTIKQKYYRTKNEEVTNVTTTKPLRSKTNPKIKIQLAEVAEEIKAGKVSDDDAKIVGDALADAISDGIAAPRVATKAATAIKKTKKKKPPKKKGNFERLSGHCMSFIEGLQFWADGTIQPETEDEAIEAKAVLQTAPNIIMQYSRLGVSIEQILDIAQGRSIKDERGSQETGLKSNRIIDITAI